MVIFLIKGLWGNAYISPSDPVVFITGEVNANYRIAYSEM